MKHALIRSFAFFLSIAMCASLHAQFEVIWPGDVLNASCDAELSSFDEDVDATVLFLATNRGDGDPRTQRHERMAPF